MNEHPPADPWDINMVEGCHIGWYGMIVQIGVIWIFTGRILRNEIPQDPITAIDFWRRYTFALVTPLEYLYP